MTRTEYTNIGESVHHTQLDNGLHIYVDVKPEFSKSFAFFATNYGGIDTRFSLDGEWLDTPAGVAHFLEHKMFDTEDGNALQDLAANGANPNAFTSFDITGYYFESTQKFQENLKTLLSFVSIPWFTQESVDKEQGIIGQEIRMVEDDPHNQVFYGLMECLYAHDPIRVSIAGTIDSIAGISAKTLYDCHAAFYNPGNMVLCVAGNVDPEAVVAMAQEVLPKSGISDIPRDYGLAEPSQAFQAEKVQEMEVSAPLFQLGFKGEPPEDGDLAIRQEVVGTLASEVLMGASSALYAKLYAKGLINQSFGCGYESTRSCAFLVAGGESKDPWAVKEAILEEGQRLAREGIGESLWERLQKSVYGNWVRGLNSFENICVGLAEGHFRNSDFMRYPEVFAKVTKSDVEACIAQWVVAERTGLSVIRNKEK